MNFNPAGLKKYQVEPAFALTQLLRSGQNALDGSDCGVGKTYHAAAVIRELNWPTLVLAPQISLTAWRRVGEQMGVEFDCLNPEAVRTGKTPFGAWEFPRPAGPSPVEYWCSCCQLQVILDAPRPCPHHRGGIHCVAVKKKPHDYGKFRWHAGIRLLVVDEVHRFGALDSLNSEMLIAAKRQGIPVLAMSATVSDSPLNLRALGYVLDLHKLVDRRGDDGDGFYRFAFRMGCKKHPFGGLYFGGDDQDRLAKMAQLHSLIFPSKGVRVRIADLGDAFPDIQITAELYDLKEKDKINELYAEMDGAIQELNKLKLGDANLEHPLTKILRSRQELELLMVPVYEELARQALEAGQHVVVFVNFKQTMDELSRRLKTDCRIEGGQTPAKRQGFIDAFQADEEPVILANTGAGGICVSLHDVRGVFPRCGIASLDFSSTRMRQLFGRLRRSGGKSKALYRIPLVAGTVQEKIHRAVSAKLDRIDALNDCDLWAANLPLTKHAVSDLWPE